MAGLKIAYKDPKQLRPRATNPRTHSAKQIRQIAASIQQFGFVSPVLIDGEDGIIAGHGRVEAAKLLGMTDIPTVRVDFMIEWSISLGDNKGKFIGQKRPLKLPEVESIRTISEEKGTSQRSDDVEPCH